MDLTYEVVAGKYDGNERNIKYINTFDTLEEALNNVFNKGLTSYPFCEIEVHGVVADQKFIIDCETPVSIDTET